MGKTIEFARPDGTSAPGYLSEPPHPGELPGVVLFEEWWGLTDHIKETADRLAAEGFRVVVRTFFAGASPTRAKRPATSWTGSIFWTRRRKTHAEPPRT
jgi:dienelactone hydrolase